MTNKIRCSACGKKCKETDSYCRYCQEPIVKTVDTYGAPIENIELARWEEFIGENSKAFIPVFRKSEGKKIFTSANFGALVFGQLWLLYRKMYREAIVAYLAALVLIVMIFSVLLADTFTGVMITIPILLAYRIALCLFANALYKARIIREISKNAPDMRKGGTTILAPIAGDLILGAVTSVLELVFEHLIYKF